MNELPVNENPSSIGTLRRQAEVLYEQLVADRGHLERRLLDSGRDDPLKMLTGKGAMDRAIECTRLILARLDHADADTVRREPPTTTIRRTTEAGVRGERLR